MRWHRMGRWRRRRFSGVVLYGARLERWEAVHLGKERADEHVHLSIPLLIQALSAKS